MNTSDFDYYKGKRRTGRIRMMAQEYFHDNAECVSDEKTKHLTRIATSDDKENMYLLHSYKKEQGEE